MPSLTYNCPGCGGAADVAEDHVGGNVLCPHCSVEFFATPPETEQPAVEAPAPAKVPFFKSSRLKLLRDKLDDLTADGDFSADDARALFYEAMRLNLSDKDIEEVRRHAVANAVASVKRRAEETWHLTDEDEARLAEVGQAFGARIELDDVMRSFRDIYRVEVKRQLPPPIAEAPFLTESGESVYFQTVTTWAQLRVQRKGYAGTSVSIPTGISGVRFRFGSVQPVSREELTELAQGTLYVTDRRLFFDGDRRNTTTRLAKVVDLDLFADGLGVEKETGRSDFYAMHPLQGRFIEAVVRTLRE
jgi:hypothetical protein